MPPAFDLKIPPCCPVAVHLRLCSVGNLNHLVGWWAEAGAFSKVNKRGAKLRKGQGWRVDKLSLDIQIKNI